MSTAYLLRHVLIVNQQYKLSNLNKDYTVNRSISILKSVYIKPMTRVNMKVISHTCTRTYTLYRYMYKQVLVIIIVWLLN